MWLFVLIWFTFFEDIKCVPVKPSLLISFSAFLHISKFVNVELCSGRCLCAQPPTAPAAELFGVRPRWAVVSVHQRSPPFLSLACVSTDDERRRPDVFSALKLGEYISVAGSIV